MVADAAVLIPKPLDAALLFPVKVIDPKVVLVALKIPALLLEIAVPVVVIPAIEIAPAEVVIAAV